MASVQVWYSTKILFKTTSITLIFVSMETYYWVSAADITWLQGAEQPRRAPGDPVPFLQDVADNVTDPSRSLLPLLHARPRPPAGGGEPLLPHRGNFKPEFNQLIASTILLPRRWWWWIPPETLIINRLRWLPNLFRWQLLSPTHARGKHGALILQRHPETLKHLQKI